MSELHIHEDETSTGMYVNSGWSVTVWGTANKFTINGGKMEVLLGGKVYDTTVNSNGFLDLDCSWYGGSGSAHRTTVNSGGRVSVGDASLVNSVTVNAGGSMYLSAGAKATGSITIENGAYFYADPDTIFNFDLSGLSPDNSAPVNGLSFVQGAPTFTLTVTGTLDEGTYKVAEGAAGFDKTITIVNPSGRAIGTITIADGTKSIAGRDYTLTLTDGSLCITLGTRPDGFDLTNDLNTTYDIPADTTINNVYIVKDGILNVYGATSETTVSSGGSLFVFDGGLAHNVTVSLGGRLHVSAGGSANEATVSRFGYMYVSGGGSADGATVNSVGSMVVSAGGSATDTTVNWRGGLYVRKDASADDVTVNALGGLVVSGGGTATNVRENGGDVWVEDGATVTFIKNAFSGIAVDQAGCTVHSGTTATDITINKNGDLCVYDNGSAISATVNAEGEICVFSGGSMNSATVNSRGNMLVCAGGSADVVTVNVCGGLVVSGGGTATQVLENGGYVDVDPAATVTFVPNELNGLVFENDWDGATIHSGTTGIDLTFNKGNGLTVFSGGFVKNITLGYDIGLGVSSGGKVTGKMTFDAGARVTAYDGGILDFDLRETAADADALLNNLSVVKGDPTFTLTVTGSEAYGTYKLAESATGFDKTITVVNTLGETLGTLTVAGGRKLIDGRKYMLNLDESSGLSVTISDRIDLTGDLDSEFHLESDMVGSGVNVLSGGALYISSGAEADHVTVNFGGYIQFWDASGTMTNIKENGGYANTHPDATVTFLPNSFGGYTYSGNSMASIHSGTIGSGLTVCSDGGINVFSGGVAQNVTAGSRGEVSIRSGGTVDGITISSGGRLEVLSGGKVTGKLTLNDRGVFSTEIGSILDFDLTQIAPGEDAPVNDLSGRQIMSSLTLTVDGTEATGDYNLVGHVNSIYETRIITVENKLGEELGTLTVAEGTKTIGSRDYTLTLTDGGSLGITISDHIDLTGDLSGEFELEEGMVGSDVNILNGGNLRVSDGGSAEVITVNPGGTLYVSDGGSATGIVAEEGALLGVTAAPNTHAQGTYAGSALEITDTASGFTVQNGGALFVSYGGFASDTTVKSASLLQIEGGTATGVAVASGGEIKIENWGSATGIVAEDGAICNFVVGPESYAQGTYAGIAFEIGETVSGYTIHGELYVLDGGTADDITVNPGCRLNVEEGGIATKVKENGGFVYADSNAEVSFVSNSFSGLHVSGWDVATVHSGTTATDTTLIDGGMVEVFGGGVLIDTTVNAGGRLFVTGGKLTGKTTIATGAEVTVGTGSILDFDLTQTAPDADVLVNDLSFFRGYASLTLTVDGSVATGRYKLAGNAGDFDDEITIVNPYGTTLGTLTVGGGMTTIGGRDYTLNLNDGVLSLTVKAPTVIDDNGDVRLSNTMPQARYMYGCAPTSVAMILGYYDLYGYRGNDFSALIEGDVDLKSRGEGQDIFVMDDFVSALGRATATEDYVYRFFSHDPIDVVCTFDYVETTPADELEYTFVDTEEGPVLRTDIWNCISDYLGTGQFWRDNGNLSTTSFESTLEQLLNDPQMLTITDEATQTQLTIPIRYGDLQYGLYLYALGKGYSLDMKVTGNYRVDTAGGDFTFEDYRKEIDAGRPVLIIIEGHVMAGYGYNAATREIIFDNCYMADERMVWGGTYNYAKADRPMIAITTIGMMAADNDTDLALSPFDEAAGANEKLILATSENRLVSEDYCFVGSPLYLSYAVSNLGSSVSGDFDVGIYIDGESHERVASLSLEPGTLRRAQDVPLVAELGAGMHKITVGIDPDNEIQETSARNNVERRSLMVLKEGTNIVEGTITVGAGEISADAYVMNGAGIQVLDGGIASGTLIQGKVTEQTADGVMFNPGIVNVSSGGILRDAGVYEYGQLQLSGTAESLHVYENGNADVFDGGVVSGASVGSGGTLVLDAGGILTGQVRMDAWARVGFHEGSILNFDLTRAEAGAEALVNDLSRVQGTPDYSLTVNGDEADGTYSLADGAENFASTISVVNTSGKALGTLTVGETARIGGDDYTLNLNEGALSVSVVHDVTAPVITLSADTETVVLQTTLTATVDDGSTIQYRIGEFGLWKEYKEPIIASLNETYYFMAMDDAGNIGTNQITFGNIDTSGILLSTLWSQKGINPMGGNTTIMYNEYTPLDPSVTPKAHCLTGCVNTASGQLIYYFIEKGWLDLPLTLEEKDEYTSKHKATTEGGDAIVIPVKSDGSTPGTLSFAEINAMLSDFQLDSAEHAAALLYAIGVVLESKYSASSTGTSWNRVFFKRAGFEGETMGGPYFGEYYWGDMDDEMQYTITDAGFEVLIENLEAGLPVGATYPGHAFVIDGYDRESDTFHINLGWGGNQATRWYTRDEMQEELNCEYFVYDLNPEYVETFTVTDARVYGTGTMIRAFEQAAGMIGDNTVAFDPSVAGKTVELLNHISLFDEVISVKDFNMNVLVTESQGGENSYGFYADHIDVFEPTDPETVLTFHASGGSLIVSTENEFNYAFQMEDGLSGTVDANGMLIWAGKTSEGTSAAAVLQALQTCRSENMEVSGDLLDPNGWSYNGSAGEDVFTLSNSSLAVGNVSLSGGDDFLSLTGHSRLYGNIDAGDGNDSITVDSTSSVSGDLAGTCKLNFVLADRDDHAMFTVKSSASGLCADATVSVDMKDAEIGTYTLISAATGATGITDLQDLAITVTGSGEADFTLSVNGTSTNDYADLIFEDDSLKLQVKKESVKGKWTYMVYMAADNDLCYSALYDIVSMQQAKVDSKIDIYVLADRTPAGTKGSGDYETINGTYKWGSDWEDTRVGKITYSPGLTVTVDWTSWGELDTGSIETLERFVNWAQAESPAENYGLMLWDHGAEDATLCYDLTTDPDWDACITVSEVAGLLKEKGNIPLVIFNACLLGSELVATQMAGSTDVIVVSEPSSYGMSTFNSNMFFQTITPDMTPEEMAAIMVRNVEPQSGEYIGEPSMLSSVDVTDSRLGDALEALAEAVASANNDVDKDVLIHAMLQAPQDGSAYDGTNVAQTDLGFLIRDVMADPDYGNTSEGFRKALADVKTALEAVVLEYRSVPAKRGSGIAVCNSVYTAKVFMTSGSTTKEAGARISSNLSSTYNSNPLWGGLLNDLCATYLAEIEAARIPTAVFSDSEVVVDGRTVTVSDIGGFSGKGELFDCIKLHDERFFGFVITADDKSTGSFTVDSDIGAAVTVSLLAADGTEVATGTGSVSFQDLAVGSYYLRLQSETDCRVTITSNAGWWTGVDRFESNDSPETATELDSGYYSGLITCEGDPDYYLIGNYDALMYTVEVYGEEGWTVGEYDPEDGTIYEADYADGKYTMMMDPMGCLLVEGTADLAKGVNAYSVNVIPYESEWPDDVTLDDLTGTKDGVSWEPSVLMNKYTVEYSPDGFKHTMRSVTTGTAIDLLNLPSGTYQWRVTADSGKNPKWFDGEEIVSDDTTVAPNVFRSNSDANDDIFFATPVGTWDSRYCAKHVGSVGDWSGTNEMVSAAGKGRIQDLFFGSADPSTLYLTDSENGDALFLDDVYTGLPEEIEENTARLFRLGKIAAGAGDDIIDMTSRRFEYTGSDLFIYGGDGNDVIWANRGSRNSLFGDAGNDRIVGASGDDVIVGGSGNDSMHGGGGNDIFTFCDNWGKDTVEQLETGTVTLWFAEGSLDNWDEETLTYSDANGDNSVTVSGVSADRVTLYFGYGKTRLFANLYSIGAFTESMTKKIFEDTGKGLLASVSI